MHAIEYIREPARKTPVTQVCDVLVAGGGMTGVIAALAAAREGAKVALAERYASLGGVAAMGLPIQGYCGEDGRQIVKGLAEAFRQRLIALGGADPTFRQCAMHNAYMPVLPETVKLVCQQMLQEAGVDVLLGAPVTDVALADGRIQAVFIQGKSGREAIAPGQVIDCTGDADLAVAAGAPCQLPDADTLQASTLNMIVAGVDTETLRHQVLADPQHFDLNELISLEELALEPRYILAGFEGFVKARVQGQPGYEDLWDSLCFLTMPQRGLVCINTVHVRGKDGSDTRQLSDIERMGRIQSQTVLRFFREFMPGFEHCYPVSSGPWAGIRETRRIIGRDTLTLDHIRAGRRGESDIALGGYPYDFHGRDMARSQVFFRVPVYGIPYGCLTPQGVDNLLVAGRALSATQEAMASCRVMAQCMAQGEAAGMAAALCHQAGIPAAQADVQALRARLTAQGALV